MEPNGGLMYGEGTGIGPGAYLAAAGDQGAQRRYETGSFQCRSEIRWRYRVSR